MRNIVIILHFESDYWEKLLCDLEITTYRGEWAIDKSSWFKAEIVWFPMDIVVYIILKSGDGASNHPFLPCVPVVIFSHFLA